MTEAYRIQVETNGNPADCGYDTCSWQPWVNEACTVFGDGTEPACATETGGPGAYTSFEDALPAPMPPDMTRFDVAAMVLLGVLAAVVVIVVVAGWRR